MLHKKGLDWCMTVAFSRYSYNLNAKILEHKPRYIEYSACNRRGLEETRVRMFWRGSHVDCNRLVKLAALFDVLGALLSSRILHDFLYKMLKF